MALPHSFTPGTNMGITSGTWYRLKPENGPAGSHVVQNTLWFPVTDTVSFSQQHVWNESDNLGKNLMSSFSEGVGGAVGKVAGGAIGSATSDLTSRFSQRAIGSATNSTSGGIHLSACSVYIDSSPPTLNVRTKLFSPDGSGKLMSLLEDLRADFTGSISKGGKTGITTNDNFIQGGLVAHPEWWTVEVVSFASLEESIILTMEDMHVTNYDIIMFSPFIGKDPSLVELTIGFTHGFRGVRSSMKFGGNGGSPKSNQTKSSQPSKPKSTPRELSKPSKHLNSSTSSQNQQPRRYYGASLGGPVVRQ